uniref:DUF5681 domain-containing protein n=1 Tax=Pararhizobium sp. IMCC3301 TaxID=3067904 RepID=UPI0027424C8D|nr:DUF5681 domain-containing protein [Pararhizobium sp. IMCC3301]
MSRNYKVGYGCPPKHTRWNKGQSGNPKGRPKARSDIVQEAADILSEPVIARTPAGQTVSLDGLEAAYLALCRKGLKGHVPSLIKAINIMLEVQPVLDDREDREREKKERAIAIFEKLGGPADSLRKIWRM